uniref:Tick transposon n=1 Tax=Gadus morhua TaxID=8049 RepID=A0A8C5FT87_GADMO
PPILLNHGQYIPHYESLLVEKVRMSDGEDDILRGLALTAIQESTYKGVRDVFQSFFVVKKNVIYERAKFNMHIQREGELVDSFVTALYALAEHCSYGVLHDELIRDRLVVGLLDNRLSERMQLDADLTLDKAVRMARQSEEVKKQQVSLVRMLKTSKPATNKPQHVNKPHNARNSIGKAQCYKCGSTPSSSCTRLSCK